MKIQIYSFHENFIQMNKIIFALVNFMRFQLFFKVDTNFITNSILNIEDFIEEFIFTELCALLYNFWEPSKVSGLKI